MLNIQGYKKKSIALALAIVLATPYTAPVSEASLSSDMNNFFNNMGGSSSSSGSQLMQGQSAGYYSGGSFNARVPVRTMNLASIQLPSIKAGCGGIDIFAGGFSYINTANLINLLKSIGSSSIGYAFQLAIEVISPTIANNLKDLRAAIDLVNRSNINGCEAAKELVKGASILTGAQQKYCEQSVQHQGTATDFENARFLCQDQTMANKVVSDGWKGLTTGADGTPAGGGKEAMPFVGNLVWKSLMKDGNLIVDYEMAEFMMSLLGTVVFPEPPLTNAPAIAPTYYGSLLDYHQIITAPVGTQADVWFCASDYDCMTPVKVPRDVSLFRQKVEQALNTLVAKITTDTGVGGIPFTPTETFILTQTDLPIVQLIQAVADVNPNWVHTTLQPYKEAIIAQMVFWYMEQAARTMNTLIQSANAPEEKIQYYIQRTDLLVEHSRAELTAVLKNAGGMDMLTNNIMLFQRKAAASLTPSMQQRILFAQMLERR